MKILLKPLLDHFKTSLNQIDAKHPSQNNLLQSIQEKITSQLSQESMEFEDFGGVLGKTMKVANELDCLARQQLSVGVPRFREVHVSLSLDADTAEVQKSKTNVAPGSRTKLGGTPLWIQTDSTPICARCQKTMTFVAQIDSISNEDSDLGRSLKAERSFMFADVGMLYLFWCSRFMETQAVLQCG